MKDKQLPIEHQNLQAPEVDGCGEDRPLGESATVDAATVVALGAEALATLTDAEPVSRPEAKSTAKRRQGKPIIAQSPTVKAGGVEITILPSGVATIPGSPLSNRRRKAKKKN